MKYYIESSYSVSEHLVTLKSFRSHVVISISPEDDTCTYIHFLSLMICVCAFFVPRIKCVIISTAEQHK